MNQANTQAPHTRTAARALVDQLLGQGVRHVFCVPGESYLPVLDALLDTDIEVTVCRQEGGMAMMAEAHGKATGRPGVCFVTRGPGATNAAAGVHVAFQDSTPMIVFVGQAPRPFRGRGAWQELDYTHVFQGLAKWVVEIDDPDRVAEVTARAFHVALSGRPGPVVVALPSDVLSQPSRSPDAPRVAAPETAPTPEDIGAFAAALAAASRPLLLVGGTRWDGEARGDVADFAARFALPTATSHRRNGLFDAEHPCYAGELGLSPNPRLVARLRSADLLIVLGGRFGEVPSQGYALLQIPEPQIPVIHVYPDAEELGRVYRPALAIHASPRAFARALRTVRPAVPEPFAAACAQARAEYVTWSQVATPQPGAVNLGEILVMLRDLMPEDSILTNGAGNFAGFINRFHRVRRIDGHIAPTSGSMGYGVPAAVAMKRLAPERCVVAIAGDGDFLMTGQEFATAVQYDLPIIVIVADNASYGTIRMHQERRYPGRVVATDLRNPDFVALAQSFGAYGERVDSTAEFPAAYRRAVAAGCPAVLDLRVDPLQLSPAFRIMPAAAN